MVTARSSAQWALRIILFSAVLGWALFVAANYGDLLLQSGLTDDELYGPDAVTVIYPSSYLIFGAIAAFAVGALIAKKKLQQLASAPGTVTPLVRPAHEFATTAVIIALVLAAWAAIGVFLESFSAHTGEIDIPARIFNSYLPIVLYTALALTVLLSAFVFNRLSVPKGRGEDADPGPSLVSADTTTAAGLDPATRRSVALAYTIPIVAVAVALIFGLIVYDLTQTALEVWIWVLIQAFIAAGIIVGVFFAKQSSQSLGSSAHPRASASIGAKRLNYVLSIVFSAAVTLMSLGYGAAAVEQLRVQPSLSMNAYANDAAEFLDSSRPVHPQSITVMANGYDLQRGSTAEVLLDPGAISVISDDVDAEGYLSAEADFPSSIEAGAYSLTVRATSTDGTNLELSIEVAIDDQGKVTFPLGTDAYSDEQAATILPATFGWVASDLLPALLLLLLAVTTIYATLTVRNRESDHRKVG